MNRKKGLQSKIRGWFPQEPILPTRYKPLAQVPYMVWWLATGSIGGTVAASLLVVFGQVTGINSGYAAFLWYIEVAFLAWCIGGFIALFGYFRHKKASERAKNNEY